MKKIVTLVALTTLLATLVPNAVAQRMSTVEVEAFDTIAGYTTVVEIEDAVSYTDVEIQVTKPNGSELILEGETDEDGELILDLDGYHLKQAGSYEIKGKYTDNDEEYGMTDSFRVYEDAVSVNKSTLDADTVTAEANGYDAVQLTITLKDRYSNPIQGHEVNIISSRNRDYITPYNTTKTNDQGKVTFYAYSDEVGISTFTAYDTTSDTTLEGRAKVAFFSPSKTLSEIGGDNFFTSVLFADAGESGTIDHFEIEDIEEEVEINNLVNFTVTAYDASDVIVEDYTGEIRFSSSDDNSDLPSDYTFLAEDQGSHTFSLSLRFGTTGIQTLTVTDSDDRDIEGEIEVEVVTEGSGESTTTTTTTTTEDSGDSELTLLSPQSGTYSLNTVEISGEAEYGYYIDIYDNELLLDTIFTEADNTFSEEVELDNGSHEIYVVAKTSGGTEMASSDTVSVTIDTEAPGLDYIEISPEGDLEAGTTFSISVYSEPGLNQVGVLLDDKIYELQESIETSGVYEGILVAPYTDGLHELDVILVDSLANEIQYSSEATINVLAVEEEVVDEETTEEDTTEEEPIDEEPEVIEEEPEATPPTQVTGVEAVNGDSRVTLTWEAAEPGTEDIFIDHYKIYYGPDAELLYSTVETYDSSTTWYIPNLQNDTQYFFKVVAVDSEGNESEEGSDVISGTPEVVEETDSFGKLHESADEASIDETGMPEETPESGPEAAWIILLTLVFAELYFRSKKKLLNNI